MTEIISTNSSSLVIHSLKDSGYIVDNSVSDIKPLLNDYPEIIVYGRMCKQRRSIGFFSDESVGYKYSGQMEKAQPLTENLRLLLNYINNKFESDFRNRS